MCDKLSASEIKGRLTTKWAGQTLYYLEETDSTNLDGKRLAKEGAAHGTVILAEKQNQGRGRRGRSWHSLAGTAIYMSLLLRPDFEPDKASMLTLVMALSVTEAIRDLTGACAMIKWPNDIIIDGKKVCGILTEMELAGEKIAHIVIGIGINVNNPQEDFPEELRSMAGSLKMATGQTFSRIDVIERVLACFEKDYENFLQTLDFTNLRERYQSYLINQNAAVKVLDPQQEYTGIARGISNTGELLVEKENGEIAEVYAGEVSVRGLYGYV